MQALAQPLLMTMARAMPSWARRSSRSARNAYRFDVTMLAKGTYFVKVQNRETELAACLPQASFHDVTRA